MRTKLVAVALATLLVSACSVHRPEESSVGAVGEVTPVEAAAGATTTVPGASTTVPTFTLPDGRIVPADSAEAIAAGAPGPGATAPSAAAARTASDRGVTPDELIVGFLVVSESTFASIGATNTTPHDEVLRPFIEELNENGGINGRRVVPRITRFDPLTPDSMQASCVEQAEDHQVFASVAQGAFFGDAEVCMASKQVPLLTGNASSSHTLYDRDKGWVRSTAQSKTRNAKIWIDWMQSAGILQPGKKTALLYTDVPEDVQLVEDEVAPYLRSLGVKDLVFGKFSSSIAQTPTEAQSMVLKFSGEGVDLVLPFVSFLRMLLFTQQAETARFRPEYSASDFGEIASDATAGFPPSQWEGVRGITTHLTGIDPPGAEPTSQQFLECKRVYEEHGQEISDEDAVELLNMLHHCQHVALFAEAARRAGVNPTRQSFLAAFDSLREWGTRVVFSQPLTYGPNKLDGADLYQVVQWRSGCTDDGGCYRQIRGFERGRW